MTKLQEAQQILMALGMPAAQQGQVASYTLLALSGAKNNSLWESAEAHWVRIHDIIGYIREHFGVTYAENSRETIRKQALHHFRNAAIVEDNGRATNSPLYKYRLTDEAVELLRTYNTLEWDTRLSAFQANHDRLIDLYASKKRMHKVSLEVGKKHYTLSPGKHNVLQKAILEEFVPRFAPGSQCLYIGDTAKKDLVKESVTLARLGIHMTQHDKLPDVILFDSKRNWLFFVEAVTSVGAMTPKRLLEIQQMTQEASAGVVYVTAFLTRDAYRRFATELAWETEVWIAEFPEHMIHLNGDMFLGPRQG